jgi:hypothetical protein
MSSFVSEKLTVCQTLSLDILSILASLFLGVSTPHDHADSFPRMEGGIQGLAGLAPSSKTAGFLLRAS